MAIQPIDLQVLFSRLEQVGKEQAAQKDVSVQNQVLQGSELVKKTEQLDHSVNESREAGENGVIRAKDEKRRKNPGQKRKDGKPEESVEPDKEIVTDPNLGKNIDLRG